MRLIAKGVWQFSGFPRDMFNVYLVEDVLIDAATRWAKRRILRQLQDRPLRLLALTHCHPDHQGVAKVVCERFGVPLACHEADVAAVEGRSPMVPNNWALRLSVRLCAGSPYPVGRVLHEGDEVAGFQVVHVPGHTPGHILFFRPADRVAIVGDVLFNMSFLTGKPGLREPPAIFCVDAAQNHRSIRTLIDLKPSIVCFGHGPPLRNPELLEQVVARKELALAPTLTPATG